MAKVTGRTSPARESSHIGLPSLAPQKLTEDGRRAIISMANAILQNEVLFAAYAQEYIAVFAKTDYPKELTAQEVRDRLAVTAGLDPAIYQY